LWGFLFGLLILGFLSWGGLVLVWGFSGGWISLWFFLGGCFFLLWGVDFGGGFFCFGFVGWFVFFLYTKVLGYQHKGVQKCILKVELKTLNICT